MKSLRFATLKSIVIAALFLASFANAMGIGDVKNYSGKLKTGEVCKLIYGPATQVDANTWRVNGLKFELGTNAFELSGAKLISSELNIRTKLLSGVGVLNRKVVITSEVLGVGYETGISVNFRVRLDAQSNPVEFIVSTQSYRNEFVFGSWVEGDRGNADTYNCAP